MSIDLNPSSTAVEDGATYRMASTGLPRAEKTAAVTRVRYLERELFDDSGRIRRGVSPGRAEQIVALINDLRQALGWLEVDLEGRWRWPADAGGASTTRQRLAS